METFSTILNLLDFPLIISKEINKFYNHCNNNEDDICEIKCNLSEEATIIIKKSLITKPYETSLIVRQLKSVFKKKHKKLFEDIIAITVESYVKLFSEDLQSEISENAIYSLVSLLELCDDHVFILNFVLPALHNFIEEEKLNKSTVYLSLLPQKNLNFLNFILNHEKFTFKKCDLNRSDSLYRYCLYKNRHWLYYILQNNQISDVNLNITNKLELLKLCYYTNLGETVDFHFVGTIVTNIYDILDEFLHKYFIEIKWSLKLFDFIKKKSNYKQEYELINLRSCLKQISFFLNLKDLKHYNEINEILIKYEKYLKDIQLYKNSNNISQLDLYNGFCILLLQEKYTMENENFDQEEFINNLKNVKQHLLQSKDTKFLLEIFENMFSLLFLQKTVNGKTVFVCDRRKLHFIATFLKNTLKEIKKNFSEKQSQMYQRLIKLDNYVRDALWRLNLLEALNNSEEEHFINIMLSSTNTLIHMCLENEDFEKAHDVIQMYNIQNSEISHEIEFIERMRFLKSANSEEIIKFCYQFEGKTEKEDFEESIFDFKNTNKLSWQYKVFMNIFDFAITSINSFELSKNLFDAAIAIKIPYLQNCNYVKFCHNITEVYNEIIHNEKINLAHTLISAKYPLNLNDLKKNKNFYNELESFYLKFIELMPYEKNGQFNQNHNCQLEFMKLIEICSNQNTSANNYLNKLFIYLNKFSEIFYLNSDNTDILSDGKETCIFDILYKNSGEIIGKLITDKNVPIKSMEPSFKNLKLDLIYYIAWNCLPEINLGVDHYPFPSNGKNVCEVLENLKKNYYCDSKSNLIIPDSLLLSYIRKHNWLLAYIINKVYLLEEAKPDNSNRTKYFNNLLNIKSIEGIKGLFNNNNTLTVIQYENSINNIVFHLEKLEKLEDWSSCLDLIDCLPEKIFYQDNILHLRDFVVYNIINSGVTTEEWKIVHWIRDNEIRRNFILGNLNKWPGDFCIEVLKVELSCYGFNIEQNAKLQKWFHQIEVYENIKNVLGLSYWNEVYEKSNNNSKEIFNLLLNSQEILLLLKWIEIQRPKSIELLYLITTEYFLLLLKDEIELSYVKTLLDLLQFDQRVQICKDLIQKLKNLEVLEFVINYLVNLLPELENEYKNIMISIKIFSCFHYSEHDFMFCLINKPLLILEQLIMNVRLEKLFTVLETIQPILKDSAEKYISVDISIEIIDNLLRNYARKAMDFRGIQPTSTKNLEFKLMQSLDTVSVDSDRKAFVMPQKVPNKSEWMLNEKAMECMCCHETTFSMFNRRHHCRRCGRVICGNCSQKKIEILEYGSIPVRICNDCYKNLHPDDTNASVKSELSSNKSGLVCWLLTDDEKHNSIVREEFSYEYAPSVSLCLSILKSHSTSVEYPKFLLEQCKILLPYLQETGEIDYLYIIQMLKSLATVAKMTSYHNSFKAELSQCNEMLLYVELLHLLVEKDCLELLKNINTTISEYYIDSGPSRRLRDKLLELEQWSLALEVSTKVGLDITGVFAAWGKSYLKAGCLQLAREKFQYCLEKNSYQENALEISFSNDPDDRNRLRSVNLSTVSENRPNRTPPLVNEIISVLESNEKIIDKNVFKIHENLSTSTLSLNTTIGSNYDSAVCILNKLKNLKNLTEINQNRAKAKTSTDKPPLKQHYLEPYFYQECLYYLMKYGSHSSILQFYIRHHEINFALHYILDNRLSSDIFVEVYLKCLEDGNIEELQENMNKIDNTLTIWEIYLKKICCHLEANAMFNVLYQLQVFMSDYVRAAMTCIKFYKENASTFMELTNREEYLFKAQSHLKQELEQEQWVQIAPSRKNSVTSSNIVENKKTNQFSLIMKIDPRNINKYINTIWRQIEIAKFLAECEVENRPTLEIVNEIFRDVEKAEDNNKQSIPTLFDEQIDKIKLAVLALVSGRNVEGGFGIAFRIIEDYNLKYLKIYCLAGKYLAQILRDDSVIQLIECIQSSGLDEIAVNETCDEVLINSISAIHKANGSATQLENLIKLITNNSRKIDAYIEIKQLKRAYLLAIKINRISDIKKILREAEIQNQPQIKTICLKRLKQLE